MSCTSGSSQAVTCSPKCGCYSAHFQTLRSSTSWDCYQQASKTLLSDIVAPAQLIVCRISPARQSSSWKPPQTTECDTSEFSAYRSDRRSLFNVSQVDDAGIIIGVVMIQSFGFFCCHNQGPYSSQQQCEKIKSLLHEMTGLLHDCKPENINRYPQRKKIEDHFSNLLIFLKNKNYTDCAWGMVNIEIRRILFYISTFYKNVMIHCSATS
ncbi:uncharacterized protein LOC135029601 [Pseudophryne corroboree]|uniref:uncharacterized protein LOC135029585 n=2 Tax=Pseudophryne corroboree TaxID=495146 RepID=UPI003082170B